MSKVKICLDAGHYGKYNRSVAVPAYYESDMTWKLHLKLKAALEEYGIEVITTRANQNTDRALNDRGRAAAGCNLFLSIHSNAVGSTVNENTDYPLAIVPLDGSGNAIGAKLAKCIEETMGTSQKSKVWSKASSKGYDWYGVIRGATSVGVPGLILEHSFHTQTRAAKWLLDDANLDKLAQAEAAVIAEHYGVSKFKVEVKTMYKVSAVRTYDDEASARDVLSKLTAAGFTGGIEAEKVEVKVPVTPTPTPAPAPAPTTAPEKSLDEIAKEVINGNYGNGHTAREANLRAAGMLAYYTYDQIRNRVNELLTGKSSEVVKPTKSLDELAKEVINGDYGNGHATREANLRAAGMLNYYTYDQIRKRVNELLK